MNRILNGDYSIDIKDYEEGDISNLKNDIYKMTIKLREQTEQSRKDKTTAAGRPGRPGPTGSGY